MAQQMDSDHPRKNDGSCGAEPLPPPLYTPTPVQIGNSATSTTSNNLTIQQEVLVLSLHPLHLHLQIT